mmetsp:Transcript_33935/g.54990  ORF Transcript_33935/g.54990 Transcript_33935/m.54990 type:complete len:325 (-) Transcript_33935:63-1037(-)
MDAVRKEAFDKRWAESTRAKQDQQFRKYEDFCLRLGLDQSRYSSIDRFLVMRFTTAKSSRGNGKIGVSTLEGDRSAIITSLKRLNVEIEDTPWESKIFFMGLKRWAGRPRQPKRPIVPKDVQEIARLLPHPKGKYRLLDHRDLLVLCLGVSAFLRGSEVASLRIEDIEIVIRNKRRWLTVFLPNSKTDQGRQGAIIMVPEGKVSETFTITQLYESYVSKLGRSSGPLFSAYPEREVQERRVPKGLQRATISHITKRLARLLGWSDKEVASHSLRRGGATAAAQRGVPERVIASQGRWSARSQTVRRYIEEYEEALLLLSFELGF